jgi:DMSO/TMAO reductase YedYZ molybdopterin-dependent catalytic subunit
MTGTPTSDLAPALAGKSAALIPLGDGLNFSTPLDLVDGTVVPSELFFVRCNNPPAELTARQWVLRVDGLVRQPITLGLNELRLLAKRSQEVWIECAGNSRSRFDPPTEGNQWGETAVGNAVFTGVALRDVLEAAGVETAAIEVVTTGADNGFQRGLPIDVAQHPDVMLAWEMNGAPIPTVNGGPVRLIVPRWAGIASVKWPVHIELVDQPFGGYFNAERYIVVDGDGRTVRTVRELPVKSIFAWPTDDGTLGPAPRTLFGFAWSGFGLIASVEVSTNGGQTWSPARLLHGAGDYAWTRWELDWVPPRSGAFELAVRATDEAGNSQPDIAEWNRFGYEMNAVATRSVVVTSA